MNEDLTTWRKQIAAEMAQHPGEELVAVTLSDEELDREFDSGYGGSQGDAFTAWSENWVYFPAVYDGAEWVASVPRHPCDEATIHVGGQ
jgi:hypothetical protein